MRAFLKKFWYSSIFLLSINTNINAQVNLIPDPSFEDTLQSYSFYGQKNLKQWKNLDSTRIENCLFGYLSYSSSQFNHSLPHTSSYYLNSRHGNGVINLTNYWIQPWVAQGQPPNTLVRSVARSKLKSKLVLGKKYCVKSFVTPLEFAEVYTNGFGIYFDNGQLDTIVAKDSSGIYSFVAPQVQNQTIIKDTQNWTIVAGTFIADGKEEFISLGNFLSDANTQVMPVIPGDTTILCECTEMAVDDVSVIPVDLANWLIDTSVLLNDSVYIGLPKYEVPDAIWYTYNMQRIDTASGIWVKPTQAVTKYIQAIDVCDRIAYDTVTVFAVPLSNNNWQTQNLNLSITPNPTTNNFTVTHLSTQQVFLFNTIGKVLQTQTTKNGAVQFDVRGLAKGIYVVKCGMQVGKVVVQ